MAKFTEKIELSDRGKMWLRRVKPLLKKNDIEKIRDLTFDPDEFESEDDMYLDDLDIQIRDFLLQQLGEELYFKGSDLVIENEFNDDRLIQLDLPANINFINEGAFSEDRSLKRVTIHSTCKSFTIEITAFEGTHCEIYVPKGCKLYLKENGGGSTILYDGSMMNLSSPFGNSTTKIIFY